MAMAVRNRLELQQQRERGLLAVIDSAQDLSSRLDLQELLSAIVSRARNLLGARRGVAVDVRPRPWRVPRAGRRRRAVAAHPAMVARRDRGVASIVMSTRLPFTTPDYLHDKRFAHDPTLDDTFREEGIAALVGVPLIWEGEVIGLLFVADRYHRTHTAQSTRSCARWPPTARSRSRTRATSSASTRRSPRPTRRAPSSSGTCAASRPRPTRTRRSRRCWRAAPRWRPCASRSRSCSAAACWCSTRPAWSSAAARPPATTALPPPAYAPHGEHRADLARAPRERAAQTAARWSPTRSTARPAARCR